MTQVFVYGTLLKGEGNWRRFLNNDQSKLLGEAVIQGFTMHDLGAFPAIAQSNDINKEIVGEVWSTSEEIFQRLDWLEGYPNFYDRMLVGTPYGEAWVYFNPEATYRPEILSGSWRQHLGRE